MTQIMNFYSECLEKYNQDIYFDIMDAFDALPLVCIVNDHYFCVHGGITSLG
jgi:serine/threonine-protein phosphatase 2B catalytic subunit